MRTSYAPSNFNDSLVDQQLAVFASFSVGSLEIATWANTTYLVEPDRCFNLAILVLWRTSTNKVAGKTVI